MKNFFNLLFLILTASFLTGAPAPQPPAAKAAPAKPAVPEQKQPYELWMIAHDKALELARQKKYDEALPLLDEAIKTANRSIWKNYSFYEKIRLLTEMKKYDEAIALLRKKLPRDRETLYHQARVRLMCGEIFMLQKKFDDARKEFAAAASYGLNNWISADAELNTGRIYELQQNYAEAAKSYRKILCDESRLPGIRAKALLYEAEMLKKRKLFTQALTCLEYQKNIEQLPSDRLIDLAFMCSELQVALKDLKGARQTLLNALNVPDKPAQWLAGIYSRLAKVAWMEKKLQEAANWIRRAYSVRGHEWGYDKALHRQIDGALAQAKRERIQKERKARLERERKLRLERQRKKQLEKKRQNQKLSEKKVK